MLWVGYKRRVGIAADREMGPEIQGIGKGTVHRLNEIAMNTYAIDEHYKLAHAGEFFGYKGG